MKRAALLALPLFWCAGDGTPFEVAPRELTWNELDAQLFDLRWRLPETRRAPGRDLLAEMRTLAELRFELEDPRFGTLRNLGDLAAAARRVDAADRAAWLTGLRPLAPGLFADWGAGLSQLLLDEELFAREWNPADDHDADGILTAEAWDLTGEGAPWNRLEVEPSVEQAALLYFADLAAIKTAENDYGAYANDVGAAFEWIRPTENGYARGRDPDEREFAAVRIEFECDLPFPFSSYRCDLRILNRSGGEGRLITDIYSKSKDFHWLAGRDVYLPVVTSRGERVAYLAVRHYGFDLDGVPDKPAHRREALRASLGNLRRRAEAVQTARPVEPEETKSPAAPVDSAPRTAPGAVPNFPVRGIR